MARFRRRRRRRINFGRAKSTLARLQGNLVTHRIYAKSVDISALATTGVVTSLLLADDDPDYDIKSDGTTIAEAQARSKIVKIDLKVWIITANATLFEFALFRDPDNGGLIGTTAGDIGAKLFDPDYTAGLQEAKKNCLVYRAVQVGSTSLNSPIPIRIRRKALMRTGLLRDNDRLKMAFNSAGNSTGAIAHIIGRIYTRSP